MRWLLVLGIALASGFLVWLGVTVQQRAERERRALEQQQIERSASVEEAKAEEGARAEPATARLEGTISGRYGGIWGVRVAVLAAGTDTVLGEAYTGTDGHYAIDLEADAVVDVLVEPARETGLPSKQRNGVRVPATVDLAFVVRSRVEGRLVVGGHGPVHSMEVTAVRAREYREVDHPAMLRRAVAGSARVRPDASFRFDGLPEGEYRLVIQSNNWMLAEPVRFRHDTAFVEGVAVRAFALRLRVEDDVLRFPVDRFRVLMDFGDGVVLRWEGRDGRLSRRVRFPDRKLPTVEIVAPGFKDKKMLRGFGASREGADTVLLESSLPPNARVDLRYDDGEPFVGRIEVSVVSTHGGADLQADISRGIWTRRLPRGRWLLFFSRKGILMEATNGVELDVPETGAAAKDVVLQRLGELVLEGAYGDDASVVRVSDGRRQLVPVGKVRLPPGRYRVENAQGTKLLKEIAIVPGGRVRVKLRP